MRSGREESRAGHAGHGADRAEGHSPDGGKVASAVLHVGGMYRASEKAVVEQALGRRPGVISVEANPVGQTATVTFDTTTTSVVELRRWVQDCGFHCAGQSVPEHICDPLMEPVRPTRCTRATWRSRNLLRHRPSTWITPGMDQ